MSLSQKHFGKVLVPWFNSAEWRHVCSLVNSNKISDKIEALNILHIWKIRTPLLSAGIEGTLIILEAISTKENALTEEQIKQIYALSLMRFLNICAANSDKQGNFGRTITETDLPKWLISIRHDIAHNNKLPELSVLEMALNICFSWLKENYWESQSEYIVDYIVVETDNSASIINVFNVYVELNLKLYNTLDPANFDEEFISKVSTYVPKRFNKLMSDPGRILTYIENLLKEKITVHNVNFVCDNIVNTLVSRNGLLSEFCRENNSDHILGIDVTFMNIWKKLLNILHEKDLVFNVINKLFDVTIDEILSVEVKTIAAYWINDLFKSFTRTKLINKEFEKISNEHGHLDSRTSKIILKTFVDKNPQFNNTLDIETNKMPYEEGQRFQVKLLEIPNEYTTIYLESVLKFNECVETFISDTLHIIHNYNIPKTPQGSQKIFDIGQFTHLIGDTYKTVTDVETFDRMLPMDYEELSFPESKWRPVPNPGTYTGLPLGVLPSQSRFNNPVMT